MKSVFLFLVLLASAVFALPTLQGHTEGIHTPMPGTDFVFDTNVYDPDHVYGTAFATFSNYWIADDFSPNFSGQIEQLFFWTVTTTTNPSGLEVTFFGDDYPGPGTILWQNLVSDVIWKDSGVTFAGYTIHVCVTDLPNLDYMNVWTGTTYWITAHREDGSNLYAVVDDEVNGDECYRITTAGGEWAPISSSVYDPVDMFRIVKGTIYGALDRTTWGMVKTLF